MQAIDRIKSILNKEYESEAGDKYRLNLMEGMTDRAIEAFKQKLPNHHLPKEIETLLRFANGFSFLALGDIRFDAINEFGLEEVFPSSINLAGDGLGNFWILDIDSKGEWREVYYVCHDPSVIVKHSNNLSEFIHHIDEYGSLGSASHLALIHEKVVHDIYADSFSVGKPKKIDYEIPQEIKHQLPESYQIVDLTNEPIQAGFNWAKYGANSQIIRLNDQAIWVIG